MQKIHLVKSSTLSEFKKKKRKENVWQTRHKGECIQSINETPTFNIISNCERLNAFNSKIRKKSRMSSLITLILHGLGNLSQYNQT